MGSKYLVYCTSTNSNNVSMPQPEEFTNLKAAWRRAYRLAGGHNERNSTTIVQTETKDVRLFAELEIGGYSVVYAKNGIDWKVKKWV